MGNPPWACLRKKDLGWDRGVESKKVVQHVYLVGAKSIYRVAEKDKEYLRDEEEKNQNTACGASCWRRGSLHPNASQVFGYPETTSTMKVARTVWELVFVNMMICSKYNDKETIGQVQKHARNAFLDVVTCKYLPAVRKAEIALFCFNFSAYRFIYIKYKSKKKLA